MDKKIDQHFEKYIKLRTTIDILSEELTIEHLKNMQCKKGCDMCCIDYNIFPIEFYSILKNLKEKRIKPVSANLEKKEVCIFLIDHACSIYVQRPIICRTHGLPLLFVNEISEWELSTCELNFTEYNFEKFTTENTLPLDKYNSKLFMLNKEFIADFKNKKYTKTDLIPLKQILNYL